MKILVKLKNLFGGRKVSNQLATKLLTCYFFRMDNTVKGASTSKCENEKQDKIQFLCKECSMTELVNYYGKKPPFTRNIEFIEESYIMKDPFSAPPSRNSKRSYTEYFIVIGSKCCICEETFCKDCSIYYDKTFCYRCAYKHVAEYPLEIQSKIRKKYLEIKK